MYECRVKIGSDVFLFIIVSAWIIINIILPTPTPTQLQPNSTPTQIQPNSNPTPTNFLILLSTDYWRVTVTDLGLSYLKKLNKSKFFY